MLPMEDDKSAFELYRRSKSILAEGGFNLRKFVNLSDIAQIAVTLEPTNRNIVGLSTNFYDPLGLVSPVTVQFKLLFKALCEAKVEWDQQLVGELLLKSWNLLLLVYRKPSQCWFPDITLVRLPIQ